MQQGILKIRAELLAPFAAASDVYKSEVDELIKVHGEHEYVLMKVHQKQTNGAAGDAGGKPANNDQDPVDPVDPGADRVEPLTFESKEEFEDSCGEIVVETEPPMLQSRRLRIALAAAAASWSDANTRL